MKSAFKLLNEYFTVSHETFERLKIYHDMLLRWQKTINLISSDTIDDIWRRHFLDSLQLIKYIENKNKIIVDLGSGGGFPSIPLVIFGYEKVHLIESDKRKSIFLREVLREVDGKACVHNCRIEDNPINNIDIFTSRACASIDALLQLIELKVPRGTDCLFHKGKNYSIEDKKARLKWQYDMSVFPSLSDNQGVVVKLSNISKRL